MKLKYRGFFALFTLLGLLFSLVASSAWSRELDLAVGWTKPPYVIAEGNTGFELDLMRMVFNSLGHDILPIYVPYGRSYALLASGNVDLTLTINQKWGIEPQFLSDVYVTYQNVAISLKKHGFKIEKASDLQFYSVVAFQRASVVLGEKYAQAVEKSRLYIELPEQRRQVDMLLMGYVEVAVMDVNIFIHLSKSLTGESQLNNVNIHPLFPASPYRAGFKDMELKQQFNQALNTFMASDRYKWLIRKYALYQYEDYNID